jgi:hypothetical protein
MRRGGEQQMLHIFAVRADAERLMKKAGARRIIADPITDFASSTLPWAAERGHTIVVEPIPGAGPLEIPAIQLRTRLQAA